MSYNTPKLPAVAGVYLPGAFPVDVAGAVCSGRRMLLGFILVKMFPTTKTICLFLDLKPIGLYFIVLKISLSYS